MAEMRELLLDRRIPEILEFFNEPDSLKKQKNYTAKSKKIFAIKMIGTGVFLIFVFWLINSLGVDKFCAKAQSHRFNSLFAILYVIYYGILISGIGISFFAAISLLKVFLKKPFLKSLEKECSRFYNVMFCKKVEDNLFGPIERIVNVNHFIPVPVLKSYESAGWETYIVDDKETSGSLTSIECFKCKKKTENCKHTALSMPMSTKSGNKNEETHPTYLKCENCGNFICNNCMSSTACNVMRCICPLCGKATNGWKGLVDRWINARHLKTQNNVDFQLSKVKIDKNQRNDPRIFDIIIHLQGKPFGSITFANVAINIYGYWFLSSPEPIINDMNFQ